MYISLAAIILMNVVIPAANQVAGASGTLHISEVVRVFSPYSFECRISNYKPAPAVRFRVSLAGFDAQSSDDASKKLLEERLKSAKDLELRNAVAKSYFRVEGELWIDGKLFELAPSLDTIRIEKHPPKPLVYQSTSALAPKPIRQPEPAAKAVRSSLISSFRVEELLETKVDCSMLTENMPLSEALNLLSESVQPRLPLLIRWDDLQANAFIEKDTPIGVEGFGRLKLRYALNHILQAAAGREPKPALIAEGGILILGSHEMLLKHRNTRVYDVKDLLAVPSTNRVYQQSNQGNLGNIVRNLGR